MRRLKGIRNTNQQACQPGLIKTRYGRDFSIDNFDPTLFTIEDIADSLSKQARYVGNIPNAFYSVAQHCVMGAQAFILCGELDNAYDFMHHEDLEAFTGDILAPIKHSFPGIKQIEDNLEAKLFKHWDVRMNDKAKIKKMDLNLCEYEMTCMLAEVDPKNIGHLNLGKHQLFAIDFWSPEVAKQRFLGTLKQIEHMRQYQMLELATEEDSHILKKKPIVEPKP